MSVVLSALTRYFHVLLLLILLLILLGVQQQYNSSTQLCYSSTVQYSTLYSVRACERTFHIILLVQVAAWCPYPTGVFPRYAAGGWHTATGTVCTLLPRHETTPATYANLASSLTASLRLSTRLLSTNGFDIFALYLQYVVLITVQQY